MKTYEEMFYLRDAGFFRRAARNLRLLAFLARGIWVYWTLGRRLRRAYRAQALSGGTLWLD